MSAVKQNTYQHETGLAPVNPFDRLQPTTRQFTGTPHVHRAYVLNRTTGKIVEACGHRHRTDKAAKGCAESMMGAALAAIPRANRGAGS